MWGPRLLVSGGALLLALVLSVASAPVASAVFTSDPIGPVGWVPDGPVHAVTASGERVFVGGTFTGGVVALDAETGALLWSGDADGDVRALAVSADGSHVIAGGTFTSIAGKTHRRLASLEVADGDVESTWRASAGGTVRDIVIRGDVAYFGGFFRRHNGLEQRGLGAVLVSTGRAVAAFDASTDANVYGVATDGSRLFVAGKFTQVSGLQRHSLASVTLATNAVDPWTPARACSRCNLYWDVVAGKDTVYVATRNDGAVTAFGATSGARRWQVRANGDAQALALADGVLYAGGHFAEIGTPREPRSILAALNPATGVLARTFKPRFVTSWPGIWALEATSSRLYVGGHFTAAGPTPPRRYPYLAMFGN